MNWLIVGLTLLAFALLFVGIAFVVRGIIQHLVDRWH